MQTHDHGHDHGHDQGHEAAHPVHNMALVGDHRIFLSHLPMFMAPHDAQVLLEADFVKDGKAVNDVYFGDRAAHRAVTFYTVQPEPFELRELFQPDAGQKRRTQFRATVFRGHLEKGGTPVERLQDIHVRVKRLVHARSFEGSDKRPALTYLLFGDERQRFMAHFISKAPDFDQILAVSVTGQIPSASELKRGVTVDVGGRRNAAEDRLHAKETVPGRGHVAGAHQFVDLNVVVQAELYFEEGELRSTRMSDALFAQTKEERKAGFD